MISDCLVSKSVKWIGATFLSGCLVAGLSVCFVAGIQAQDGVIFSTTGDGRVPGFDGGDSDIYGQIAGQAAYPWMTLDGLRFLLSDLNGDGIFADEDDVDALCFDSVFPGDGGLAVSMIRDVGATKDGDLFSLHPQGGIRFIVTEDEIIQATGAVDGNVDLDAAHLDPNGVLWFSFAEDEACTRIDGEDSGIVRAEEVMSLTLGADDAAVGFDAAEIRAFVSNALGIAPFDVLDLLSLTRGDTGDFWFSVQSPSSDDATVFSMRNGGTLVSGRSESDFGFSNSAEMDALAFVPSIPAFPVIALENSRPQAGDTVRIQLWNGPALGLVSGIFAVTTTDPSLSVFGGYGLALSPADPLLHVSLQLSDYLSATCDQDGRATIDLGLVPGGGPIDVAVQAWSGVNLEISNPVWLEMNQ